MTIHVGILLAIILIGFLFTKTKLRFGQKKIDGKQLFFILTAIMLIFISAFRGDFATDYQSYVAAFNRSSEYVLKELMNANDSIEVGYHVFQSIVKKLFDDSLYLFIFSSILVVLSNLWYLKKYTEDYIVAVMLFVIVGMYYPSFNVMRQCMAASIVILGSKYLIERKPVQYFTFVILASSFHISALIMILFYFVSTVKINKKYFIVYFFMLAIMLQLAPQITNFAVSQFWNSYDISARGTMYWKTIVLPTLLVIFAFINYLLNNKNGSVEAIAIIQKENGNTLAGRDGILTVDANNILLNATFMFLYFKIFGLFLDVADRMSIYFSIYAISFYARQITNSKYRNIIMLLTMIMLVVYEAIVNKATFYFIWD